MSKSASDQADRTTIAQRLREQAAYIVYHRAQKRDRAVREARSDGGRPASGNNYYTDACTARRLAFEARQQARTLLAIARGDKESNGPECIICGIPLIGVLALRVLEKDRKGGNVTKFICRKCDEGELDADDVDENGNRTLSTFTGGEAVVE